MSPVLKVCRSYCLSSPELFHKGWVSKGEHFLLIKAGFYTLLLPSIESLETLYDFLIAACLLLLLQLFYGPWTVSGITWLSRYQKGKTNLDLREQETVSGSGISWALCKFAPRPRQITMPASHQSVFYRPDAFLLPNQQCQSTEGMFIYLLGFTITMVKTIVFAIIRLHHYNGEDYCFCHYYY